MNFMATSLTAAAGQWLADNLSKSPGSRLPFFLLPHPQQPPQFKQQKQKRSRTEEKEKVEKKALTSELCEKRLPIYTDFLFFFSCSWWWRGRGGG